MSEYSLRLAKPHCENCHKSKNDKFEGANISTTITDEISPMPLSLSERLEKTLKQTQ